MKIYKTQSEFESEIVNNVFKSKTSIDVTSFQLSVKASLFVMGNINADDLDVWTITANNIKAGNINACNINARDITACDITAWDLIARNVRANDIRVCDLIAHNVRVDDISAENIVAKTVSYFAVCFAYENIVAVDSITGRRKNCKHFALDGAVEVKGKIVHQKKAPDSL